MSPGWTSFKIGLLTLVVAAASAVIALVLGIRPGPDKTVQFRTYFDESVAGLDVGAPVKFRGISVGTVKGIAVAPDGRRVEVRLEVDDHDAWLLRWHPEDDNGLRAQVSSPGLTGVKLLDIEYLDPEAHPPPPLPFPTPEGYVPAVRGSGVQASLAKVADSLVGTLRHADRLLEDVEAQEVPEKIAVALGSLERAAEDLRTTVRRVNQERIPDRTAETLARLDTAIGSMQEVLRRVGSDGGLLAGAERATESVDALGRRAAGATDELDRTLRDLGDAARTMRSLADTLEREPDMLLKGRKKGAR